MPEVANIPQSVVRILNHPAWAPQVAQLVDDIITDGDTVTLMPCQIPNVDHFIVDAVKRSITVSDEERATLTVIDDESSPPDQLLVTGVLLKPQSDRQSINLEFADTATGDTRGERLIQISELPTVEIVASEQIRQLRNEATLGSSRLKNIITAGRKSIVRFIDLSMKQSGITGAAAKVVSLENITLIRAGLLRCFPPDSNTQAALSVVKVTDTQISIVSLSTTTIRPTAVTADRLHDVHITVFWCTAGYSCLPSAEKRRFSAASHKFKECADADLRTPMTFVIVSHNPEKQFVERLTATINAPRLTAWVKNPDVGFYMIPYTHSSGLRAGEQSEFNPDFLLFDAARERPHVFVVEIKSDNDRTADNADKIRAAEDHVAYLNRELPKTRPTYSAHLLSPNDYIDFFIRLEDGTADDYVGLLHQSLKALTISLSE
jgi:hypothetical protein